MKVSKRDEEIVSRLFEMETYLNSTEIPSDKVSSYKKWLNKNTKKIGKGKWRKLPFFPKDKVLLLKEENDNGVKKFYFIFEKKVSA